MGFLLHCTGLPSGSWKVCPTHGSETTLTGFGPSPVYGDGVSREGYAVSQVLMLTAGWTEFGSFPRTGTG